MDVTVVVATFGQSRWVDLALQRAIPSAEALHVPVVHHHGATIADARNGGLAQVDTEWVCHLDADDELEAGYFDEMDTGMADVRAPSVRYHHGHRAERARVPNVWGHDHECVASCLEFGNWLVIGAVVRTELVRRVGGHMDFDWSEDWSLWRRCAIADASFEQIPKAVYRAWVSRDSRNRSADHEQKMRVHRQIEAAHPWPVSA